jgi:FixJ family two-component response regulator
MHTALNSVIAVIDDDVRLLESLEDLLESAGHSVHVFASAKSFLQEARCPRLTA